MGRQIRALIELTRPGNCLLVFISVVVGALLAGDGFPVGTVLALAISGTLIAAGGNVLNDYFDLEIDRVNKPHRVLPSRRVGSATALTLTWVLFPAGLVISLLAGARALFVALVATGLLSLYDAVLKKRGLWGNVSVSFLCGLAFLYGGLASGRWGGSWFPAAFAFFFHLGREIIKDIEDMEADRALGARTFPIVHGVEKSLLIAGGAFLVLIALTPLPVFIGLYGWGYLGIVGLGVDLLLVILYVWLRREPHPSRFGVASRILKWDMVVGLLALILGRLES